MQVHTSLQTDNHASTTPLSFLQAGCLFCHPANSVEALNAVWCMLLLDGNLYVWTACVVFTAVKFGRMSKKQRERVEDEAKFHKQQLQLQQLSGEIPAAGHVNDTDESSVRGGSSNNNNRCDATAEDRLTRYTTSAVQ